MVQAAGRCNHSSDIHQLAWAEARPERPAAVVPITWSITPFFRPPGSAFGWVTGRTAPDSRRGARGCENQSAEHVSHQSCGWGRLVIAGQQRLVNALQALRLQQLNRADAHEFGAALNQLRREQPNCSTTASKFNKSVVEPQINQTSHQIETGWCFKSSGATIV